MREEICLLGICQGTEGKHYYSFRKTLIFCRNCHTHTKQKTDKKTKSNTPPLSLTHYSNTFPIQIISWGLSSPPISHPPKFTKSEPPPLLKWPFYTGLEENNTPLQSHSEVDFGFSRLFQGINFLSIVSHEILTISRFYSFFNLRATDMFYSRN